MTFFAPKVGGKIYHLTTNIILIYFNLFQPGLQAYTHQRSKNLSIVATLDQIILIPMKKKQAS